MIVRCPDCRSKYEVTGDRMPPGTFKLRCPRCKAVFPVSGAIEPESSAVPRSVPAAAGADARPTGPVRDTALPPPAGPQPAEHVLPTRPKINDPALARRMARAMISEMVLNRRADRDEALRNGTVLSRFGTAIAAAYSVYREKVSPDLNGAPTLFRDAVNDILGEGRPVL